MQREHNQERRINQAFHRAQAAYDAMLPPEPDDDIDGDDTVIMDILDDEWVDENIPSAK